MTDKLISSMRSAFHMTKQRCYNSHNRDYRHYGGRGITICDRWLESFDNFVADMGLRPDGCTLERIDNSAGYSPENCVWASRARQSQNTRQVKLVTYDGRTMSVAEWERQLGWRPGTLKARLGTLKYSVEEAMTKPVKYGGTLPERVYKTRRKPDMSRVPRGYNHPQTKISREQAAEIRRRYAEGDTSYSRLGREYEVSVQLICDVVNFAKAYREREQCSNV